MGRHSMKQKKPRAVISVGPVWLENVYQKARLDGKRIRVLVKQYEPNPGANRYQRRAALAEFRRTYGREMFNAVMESQRKGTPLDEKVKVALDEFIAGKVYQAEKRKAVGARI